MPSRPKTGKTTTAAKFEKALILATETGYLAIPGIMAQPINSWSDFKMALRQLKQEAAKEAFYNIVIDTVDIAYDLCEKYICSQNDVDSIGDIPYGGGYKQAEHEFDECLRLIPQLGYGLILISHSQDKVFKDENGSEFNQIVPTLATKPRNIVNRMSDIIGYAQPIQDEDGSTHTRLYMRGTPRFVAGSRFKHTPEYIDFTYDNLVNAIGEAIDKLEDEMNGKFVVDKPAENEHKVVELNFDELMTEFNTIVGQIQSATGGSFGMTWAPRITSIVEQHLGKGKKISEATAGQAEQVSLIVYDLKEAIANGL